VPEESEPGFSQRAIEAPAPVPGDARARRVVPRIVVRPEGAGQLPGDISTTEDVLANPEDDPLQ
jgi:hypothetical protein